MKSEVTLTLWHHCAAHSLRPAHHFSSPSTIVKAGRFLTFRGPPFDFPGAGPKQVHPRRVEFFERAGHATTCFVHPLFPWQGRHFHSPQNTSQFLDNCASANVAFEPLDTESMTGNTRHEGRVMFFNTRLISNVLEFPASRANPSKTVIVFESNDRVVIDGILPETFLLKIGPLNTKMRPVAKLRNAVFPGVSRS